MNNENLFLIKNNIFTTKCNIRQISKLLLNIFLTYRFEEILQLLSNRTIRRTSIEQKHFNVRELKTDHSTEM